MQAAMVITPCYPLLTIIKSTICIIIPPIFPSLRCFAEIKRCAILSSHQNRLPEENPDVRLLGSGGNDLSVYVQEDYCPWKWLEAILNECRLILLKGPAEWQHKSHFQRRFLHEAGCHLTLPVGWKHYSALYFYISNGLNKPFKASRDLQFHPGLSYERQQLPGFMIEDERIR